MNDLFTHVSTTEFNSEGYDSANNVKHGEMEDAFMNFASATSARDAAFTKMTTTNDNLST